jgi:hypothetical protein
VDECLSKCKGEGMTCKDTVGGYECTCAYGTYDKAQDSCIVGRTSGGGVGAVTLTFIIILTIGVMAGAGYGLYKYRLRVSSLSLSLILHQHRREVSMSRALAWRAESAVTYFITVWG